MALKESTSKLSPGNGKLAAGGRKIIQSLDHAFPGKHTSIVHDGLSRSQATIVSQLRTVNDKLNHYLAKARIKESEVCKLKRNQKPRVIIC